MMPANKDIFLPGVPASYVLDRLARADGNEVSSGKLASPASSSALAVNTFGWFHQQPERLPLFPTLGQNISRPLAVEVEYCARFPWRGGRHPWLDAWIETHEAIIGVESKRFEPYRDKKTGFLSRAYDRPVWHEHMTPYEQMRDRLRSRIECFECLDAIQLVKHAFGLVTEGRRKQKRPFLIYLFAEPIEHAGRIIKNATKERHQEEITRFVNAVKDAEVVFRAISYREWLNCWPSEDTELSKHRSAIIERFQP